MPPEMPPERSHAKRPRPRKAAAFGLGLLTVLSLAGTSLAGTSLADTSAADEDNGRARTAHTVKADSSRRDKVFDLVNAADIPGLDGFSVGIDPAANKIGVFLFAPKGLPTAAKASLKFGDDVTVTVQKSPAPVPQIDVSGGAPTLPRNPVAPICTAGFAVGLASGKSGILTAGHCFEFGLPANEQSVLIDEIGGSVAATGSEFNLGPSDYGIYALDNSPDIDNALPQIIDESGIHPVRGITEPTVGMAICKFGKTTGTTCGQVTLVNTRLTIRERRDAAGNLIRPSVQVTNLIQSNLCTEVGDSGGPVYTHPAAGYNTGVNAVAIHSSGATATLVDGRQVCGEKVGLTNVSHHVPLSATPANSTNPSARVFLKVAR